MTQENKETLFEVSFILINYAKVFVYFVRNETVTKALSYSILGSESSV